MTGLGFTPYPPLSNDDFIGYIFLSTSPGWESGSGSISIPLVNLRSEYHFRIFKWSLAEMINSTTRFDNDHNPLPGTDHKLVESEVIGFEPGLGPEQVHLAFTGSVGEMRVMFVTCDGEDNVVRYGLTQRNMDRVVGTRVLSYEREDMCHAPANNSVGCRDPGLLNQLIFLNIRLKSGKVPFQVGSDCGGWSDTFSFVTPKVNLKETISFLIGDMGTATPYTTFDRTQPESSSTLKWINRDIEALGDKPAFISHIGDISYARGYVWLWDNFFNQIEPVASKVPYHVCIGNHEYDWPSQPWKPDWASSVYGKDGGGECGVPYSLKFKMPGNSSQLTGTRAPATRNLYYSFDFGVVHFVYMSTETNFLTGSDQYKPKDVPLKEKLIEQIEPLLVKNKVSLVLWGHVHKYERFCPLNNFICGSLDKNRDDNWEAYPVHVVLGMSGQDSQPKWDPREDHPNDPVFPQPEQSFFGAGQFGYTTIVATKKKLTFSFVGNHDGEVHDVVEIMAPGQVPSDAGENSKEEATESWYCVKNISLLVCVAFVAYFLGFTSYFRKDAAIDKNWAPLKNEEV
ncbi:hypothetical protein ACH5RR_030467 [Cinchona calisaya]|uniref:Purple acid phosphatase n=1 Tax=Cinchona calisaya TaxID=153742 RepID=A0ABD2YVZ5_9GENT